MNFPDRAIAKTLRITEAYVKSRLDNEKNKQLQAAG